VTEQTLLGLTLTATVSASGVGSAPSGVVTFTNGVGGPVVGTESLSGEAPSGGTVQAVANFNASPLAAGQYNFVASYPGDANYGASTSATVPMTLTADFTLGSQGLTSQTVTPGQTATYLNGIVIAPEFGYSSTVNFSCLVPAAGATCSVTPASYATANGVGFGSVTVTTTGLGASIPQPKADPSGPPQFHLFTARAISMALSLWLFAVLLTRTRRRRFVVPLALLLLMAAIAPIGCGGGSGNSGGGSSPRAQGTPAGTYTVTVTATAGSTTHTTTLTLIVQ